MTLNGLASDDVASIVAFLANGQTMKVPLRDNTFLVDVARSKIPVRLVAYDAQGRVIGIQTPGGMFGGGGISAPIQGRAVSVRKLTSPTGATAELLIGPASGNQHCYYVRTYFNKHAAGETVSCPNPYWRRKALELGMEGNPAQFIEGHVRSNVAMVKVKFADGGTMTVDAHRGLRLGRRFHANISRRVTAPLAPPPTTPPDIASEASRCFLRNHRGRGHEPDW